MSISRSELKEPYIFTSLNLALFICSTRTMFSFELCIVVYTNATRKIIFQYLSFSIGGKLALKICALQGQVIMYLDQTDRNLAFLFKQSFSSLLQPCHIQKHEDNGAILNMKQSTQTVHIFFPMSKTCFENVQMARTSYDASKLN